MGYEFSWHARSSSVDETDHIYFPELFRLLDEGIEALLEDVGYPLHRLIPEEEQALPIVHAAADYHRPVAFGDVVECTITPTVGESSVEFEGTGRVDGETVFEATVVRVLVETDEFTKRPLPDAMRERLADLA